MTNKSQRTTTPAAALATMPTATADTTAAGNRAAGAQEHQVADTSPRPTTLSNLDQVDEAFCDLSRLLKAAVAAAITAGMELIAAQRELGSTFPQFVATRTPWAAPEALAMIGFQAEAGLQPDQLTAAIAVPLAGMLEAVALLGGLYLAEVDQGAHQPDEE